MTVIIPEEHPYFYNGDYKQLEKYYDWLSKQDPIVACIAWDVINNHLTLETFKLADEYTHLGGKYFTFIGVLTGANLESFEEDIRDISLDELDDEEIDGSSNYS